MVEQARMEERPEGLTPVTPGWFVVNVHDAAWITNEAMGAACILEGDEAPFPELGFTIAVIEPGQPSGMYHGESNQEDFLVLQGECVLIIEGEERTLKAWDFVHCPPWTEHIFVGAGEGPCAIFMVGGRTREKRIRYPPDEVAFRHGGAVATETTVPREAYARFPEWQPGRPKSVRL